MNINRLLKDICKGVFVGIVGGASLGGSTSLYTSPDQNNSVNLNTAQTNELSDSQKRILKGAAVGGLTYGICSGLLFNYQRKRFVFGSIQLAQSSQQYRKYNKPWLH